MIEVRCEKYFKLYNAEQKFYYSLPLKGHTACGSPVVKTVSLRSLLDHPGAGAVKTYWASTHLGL